MNNDIRYEIFKEYGTIGERVDSLGNKWTKKMRLISWNGRQPLIDIREWSADDNICRTGMRFSWREIEALGELIESMKGAENDGDQTAVGKAERSL